MTKPEILNYIELNLLKEGFEILKAETGEKGVDLAVNNQVDLVLTDLRLPDLDGVEVMPRTPRSTHRSSSPEAIQLRFKLSNHGLWPSRANSSCRRFMMSLRVSGGQEGFSSIDHGGGGNAQLGHDALARC